MREDRILAGLNESNKWFCNRAHRVLKRPLPRHAGDPLAQKRRTLLTMFGIAWGIISITVMVAAGEGLGDGIQKINRPLVRT